MAWSLAVGCGGGRPAAAEGAGAPSAEPGASGAAWAVEPLDEGRYVRAAAEVACASRRGAGAPPSEEVARALDAVYARHRTTAAEVAAFGAEVNASPDALRVGGAVAAAMAACP